MARLGDIAIVMRKVGPWTFVTRTWVQVGEDNIFVWAASLAYSWLLALFPFLIFLLTLLPYVPDQQKQQALNSIEQFLKQLPAETSQLLRGYVDATITRVLTEKQTGLMSLGIVLSIWAASGGMAMTMSALDRCYHVDVSLPFYKQRPLAILLTIVTATLMLLVVALLPVGGIVLDWLWYNSQRLLGYQLPTYMRLIIDVARWGLGLFLISIVLNVVYHYGCQIKQKYRFITPGAVFCILSWVALGLGFRFYVDHIAMSGYSKTYGTVGGVVILLFLLYLAATILLVGAEINSVVDYEVQNIPRGTIDFRKKPTTSPDDPEMPSI